MELIFKLPAGKPPFVGILFKENEIRKAATLNKQFIGHVCTMSIFAGSKARVHIGCNDPWMIAVYTDIDWNMHHAKVFWNQADRCRAFNFGHVLQRFNKHEIITTLPERKNFVIQLEDLKINFD